MSKINSQEVAGEIQEWQKNHDFSPKNISKKVYSIKTYIWNGIKDFFKEVYKSVVETDEETESETDETCEFIFTWGLGFSGTTIASLAIVFSPIPDTGIKIFFLIILVVCAIPMFSTILAIIHTIIVMVKRLFKSIKKDYESKKQGAICKS